MNAPSNIFKRLGLIAQCGLLIALSSLDLSVTHAGADACYAEGSCLICDRMDPQHSEARHTHAGSVGCAPGAQNTACDVEKAPDDDGANYPVAFIRVEHQNGSTIAVATAAEPSGNPALNASLASVQTGYFALPAPIYLLNQSFLC